MLVLGNSGTETEFPKRQTARFRQEGNSVSVPEFKMPANLSRRVEMLQASQFLAVLSSALFAGAAIYINVAEHPARMSCGTQLASTVFGPSYKRAAAMQVLLAVVATISGIARLGRLDLACCGWWAQGSCSG